MSKGLRNQSSSGKARSSTSGVRGKGSLIDIASSTLEQIEHGTYNIDGTTFDLSKAIQATNRGTLFFPEDSNLSDWRTNPKKLLDDNDDDDERDAKQAAAVRITVIECSTLGGARMLDEEIKSSSNDDDKETDSGDSERRTIGVLSFSSAKNPGGGFKTGAQAQEESIARSSTLYPSLMTDIAQSFYRSHRKDPKGGYYSHAMVYSPRVLLIRNDDGAWHEPVKVDILTSCAVNAGVVRRNNKNHPDETGLDNVMKERMARILYLFENQGVRHLVLGSFGTGVFRNRVELVAQVWKELLVGEHARFRHSFDRVVFAILGNATYTTFRQSFSDPDTVDRT